MVTMVFKHNPKENAFNAFHQAEQWCHDQGYFLSTMEREKPILVFKDFNPCNKFRNISKEDRQLAIGKITGVNGRFRECDITIELNEEI